MEAYEPGPEDYIGQFARYADARAAGTPLPVTLADARTALELVTALYVSAHDHREVHLPLNPSECGVWERHSGRFDA